MSAVSIEITLLDTFWKLQACSHQWFKIPNFKRLCILWLIWWKWLFDICIFYKNDGFLLCNDNVNLNSNLNESSKKNVCSICWNHLAWHLLKIAGLQPSMIWEPQLQTTVFCGWQRWFGICIHLIQKRLSSELLHCALRIVAYPDCNAPWM